MARSTAESRSDRLTMLSSREVADRIARGVSLAVPVGALEPLGTDTPLGLCEVVAAAVAEKACAGRDALVAPTVSYACGVPFGAFEGSTGVRPRSLTNALLDMLPAWLRQGFRTIVLVDCSSESGDALRETLVRLDGGTRVCVYRWGEGQGSEDAARVRDEAGLLSTALFLGMSVPGYPSAGAGSADLRRWRRRGRDPELLRTLCPSALLTPAPHTPERDLGERLFTQAVARVAALLEPHA